MVVLVVIFVPSVTQWMDSVQALIKNFGQSALFCRLPSQPLKIFFMGLEQQRRMMALSLTRKAWMRKATQVCEWELTVVLACRCLKAVAILFPV